MSKQKDSTNPGRSLTICCATLCTATILWKLFDKYQKRKDRENDKNKKKKIHFIANERYCSLLNGSSMYVSPLSMYFDEYDCNGNLTILNKRWDLIEAFNVVCGIIYDIKKESFLFVKQFRPPVYYNHKKYNSSQYNKFIINNSNNNDNDNNSENNNSENEQIGVTYELCAGIMDKQNKTEKETMKEEFIEECGYDIPLNKIIQIAKYTSATGVMGNHCYVFMAFVDDSMKIKDTGFGGSKNENENIQLIWVKLNDSKKFIMDNDKDIPPGAKFAIFWFYDTFPNLCKNVKPCDDDAYKSMQQLKQIENEMINVNHHHTSVPNMSSQKNN